MKLAKKKNGWSCNCWLLKLFAKIDFGKQNGVLSNKLSLFITYINSLSEEIPFFPYPTVLGSCGQRAKVRTVLASQCRGFKP